MNLNRREFLRNVFVSLVLGKLLLKLSSNNKQYKHICKNFYGYKGGAFYDVGYICAPYIPLYVTKTI